MSKKIIFIFEFISGGGFSKGSIPNSLFCEGFGMLRAITTDFKTLGFEVVTFLDYRAAFLSRFLGADIIKNIKPRDNFHKLFKKTIKDCNYAFIIAPETSNILYELSEFVKKYDKELLSTNLKCISQCSSKINTYNFFQMNRIPTPKTYKIPFKRKILDLEFIIQKFKVLNKPIIIKPEDGVGAESIFYFERHDQIYNFFKIPNEKIEQGRNYILQEYIEGSALSLSLIGYPQLPLSSNYNPIILSINSQDIVIRTQDLNSTYYGGTTPIKNSGESTKLLTNSFQKVDFSEFSGYFGIDFIRTMDPSFFFIEINPRLTTSYLGVRNVLNYNCAELIYKAKMNSLTNLEIKYLNFSLFSRVELQNKNSDSERQLNDHFINNLMKEIPEIVTPPISFNDTNQYSCFIATQTKDLLTSKKRMNEILNYFKKSNFKVLDQ
jgi:predicted ATP-grasp superfamily ATP-dependent carboligase